MIFSIEDIFLIIENRYLYTMNIVYHVKIIGGILVFQFIRLLEIWKDKLCTNMII